MESGCFCVSQAEFSGEGRGIVKISLNAELHIDNGNVSCLDV